MLDVLTAQALNIVIFITGESLAHFSGINLHITGRESSRSVALGLSFACTVE